METFSDDTLREAREKLLARGTLLTDRIKQVRADLRHGPDDSLAGREVVTTLREDDEALQAVEKLAHAEIARIEAALDAMDEGTFGLCEECGREIAPARFVAVPYATHCKSCARDG
jgi:RNA polymerase-binding transcription factor DksA